MAEFVAIPTTLTDAHALIAALADLGLSQIEVNERPVPLRDGSGQLQNQSAELIIRRENNPDALADLGFKRGQSGLFLLVVSAPDRTRYTGIWLRQLNQRYRYHVASGRLQERGFSLVKLGESVSGITQNPVQSGPPKIEALQPQGFWGSLLHMVVPGWVEQHTVEILARQPQTPRAARTLAEVVVHFDYEPSRELAFQALQQLTDRRCIDQVCEVWASVRHPALAKLLVEQGWTASAPVSLKVLTALKTERVERLNDLNPKDVGLLLQACDDIEPDVAEGAQAYLRELGNPALLDALCELWAEGRDPFLWELIQRKKYLPRRPIATRVLVGLKLGMSETFAAGKANLVGPLLEACAGNP